MLSWMTRDLFPSFADVYMTDRNMGGFYSKFMSWESYTRHNLSLFVVGVDYHTSYTQLWLFSHLNWWWGSSGWGVLNKSCSRVDRILWICFLILWSYESTPILMNCMRKMCVIITCGIVLCCLSLCMCVLWMYTTRRTFKIQRRRNESGFTEEFSLFSFLTWTKEEEEEWMHALVGKLKQDWNSRDERRASVLVLELENFV